MTRVNIPLICTFFAMWISSVTAAKDVESDRRLYRLDCGNIYVSDLNVFSDTDQYVGQEKNFTSSCYLIKKGDIWLLWDAGLPDALSEEVNGKTNGPFTLTVKLTLKKQLEELGLTPSDITYIGVSHTHFDHTGNANMFQNAKLIIQESEYNLLKKNPELAKKGHMDPQPISFFLDDANANHLETIAGDKDIFGDGTVRAIKLPGHTPGHMGLLINLPESGTIILSGDQWHFHENREQNGVPSFNHDRADTLASSDKLERLIKNTGAKLIIQHEEKDKHIIPAFPEFLK